MTSMEFIPSKLDSENVATTSTSTATAIWTTHSWLFNKEHEGKTESELIAYLETQIHQNANNETKLLKDNIIDELSIEINNRVNKNVNVK